MEKKKFDSAKGFLDKSSNLLVERQKLILIADSEKLGWKVVEQYEINDICDDEEDQKKLWRAAQRAEQRV